MWRLLTVFEAPDRCILLVVAEHTRTANPHQLLYDALSIGVPEEPRTKPACGDALRECGPPKRPAASVAERAAHLAETDRHRAPAANAMYLATSLPLGGP